MHELLKKIRANAAERLVIPEGHRATQELARYKAFLKVETHRLLMQHRSGVGGMEICKARALILDLLLQHLWEVGMRTLSTEERKKAQTMALVAIGGYGRAELNPHSDVDLMFLHTNGGLKPRDESLLSIMVDAVLYPLWDVGLKVGHAVRTIDESVRQANGDMQSKTSFVEARLIEGDAALFKSFQKAIIEGCVKGQEDAYIAQRVADQAARRAKFGNSASMQEPNIKNGCGGLRDYQNLLWMAFFKYRRQSPDDLRAEGFITESERKQLRGAYDFLLRVRTEMHYHVNRPMDVLSKSLQPAVALNLGYKERSPSKRIEGFMRDVYTHSRNIYLITRTLEQRLALLPQASRIPGLASIRALVPGRKPKAQTLDGFKFVNDEIHAETDKVFEEDPRRLMRVFLYAQQRGLRLHPDLAQALRNRVSLADRWFLKDEHVRETFLTILNQRGSVGGVLRAMHEVGLLGRYVPEFGRLTCLVQHEFYHQYTADEHTLMCIEQLDRVWNASEAPHNSYTALLQGLERPFILYLALLLHDVGKAEAGNHSATGGAMAARAAKRLALDAEASATLKLVVEQHLLMAGVSQRRDMDDPGVIRKFSHQIGNPERLALLTLHTFVDAQATSDKLWNGFKDSLLWTLFLKSMELMSGGGEFAQAGQTRREKLLEEARRHHTPFSEDEIRAHFDSLPQRYFDVHNSDEILQDIDLAHRFMRRQVSEEDHALTPVVDWQDEPNRGFTTVKVCTWDRGGLFRKIAGTFSSIGLSILSAQIFTRLDGIVLDRFFVVDAHTGNLPRPALRARFEELLTKALTSGDVDFAALIRAQQQGQKLYQPYFGENIPTRVDFDNDSADHRTIIEIETEDRIGLLHTISKTLADLRLDISTAKICTERGAAIDSFYVHERGGGKITEPARQKQIEKSIKDSLIKTGG